MKPCMAWQDRDLQQCFLSLSQSQIPGTNHWYSMWQIPFLMRQGQNIMNFREGEKQEFIRDLPSGRPILISSETRGGEEVMKLMVKIRFLPVGWATNLLRVCRVTIQST